VPNVKYSAPESGRASGSIFSTPLGPWGWPVSADGWLPAWLDEGWDASCWAHAGVTSSGINVKAARIAMNLFIR
jgi:hypothetical protein